MFEEFDYSLEKSKSLDIKAQIKRALRIVGVLFIFILFIYIVVNSYKFITQKPTTEEIKLIKASSEDIKVKSKDTGGINVDNLDIKAYDALDKKTKKAKKDGVSITKEDLVDDGSNSIEKSLAEGGIKNRALLKNIRRKSSKPRETTAYKPKREITSNSNYTRAQVAALQSKDSAVKYWDNLKRKHPNLLSDKEYFIEEVDLREKGIFYRLQIGNFNKSEEVKDFCEKYIRVTKNSRIDCILIEVD